MKPREREPFQGGDEATQRIAAQCEADELERLNRVVSRPFLAKQVELGQFGPAPLQAHPRVDWGYLRAVPAVPDNPFYKHAPPEPPDLTA